MRNFKTIMGDIKKSKEQSKVDLERLSEMPSSSQVVMLGKMRAAKESLERLAHEYSTYASSNSIVFLPYGNKQEEFVTVSRDKFGCYSTNIDMLYEEIAEDIHETFYVDKTVSVSLFDLITQNIEFMAQRIGIAEFPMPIFSKKYNRRLTDKTDLHSLIAQIINEEISIDFSLWYGIYNNVKTAMSDEFQGKVLPMIIYSSDSELNKKIADPPIKKINKASALDVSDINTDEENIKKILLKAKKSK